jgi:pimeloyl-ACP methyl ester carboxylesterase
MRVLSRCAVWPWVPARVRSRALPALLVAVAFALPACAPGAGATRRAVSSPPRYGVDRFSTRQRYNFHYVEAGEGRPVLLLTGLFGTYREWNRIFPLLAGRYHLRALDHIGVGDSDKPSEGFAYTVGEQADLVIAMMDEMHVAQADLVGVSYGGMIALNIAARYPDRVGAVVCIEGAMLMPRKPRYTMMERGLRYPVVGDLLVGIIRSGLLDGVFSRSVMGPAWSTLGDEDRREIAEIVSQNVRTASRSPWYHLSRALKRTGDFGEGAKAITAPVLYLYGSDSEFRDMTDMNVDYLRSNLPGARFVSFPGGVHDLELQKPREVAALIVEFLDGAHAGRHAEPVSRLPGAPTPGPGGLD